MIDSSLLPEYESPPLTEVMCGITFKPINGMTAAHVGVLWSSYQPDFPKIEEYAPTLSQIEIFSGQEFVPQLELTNVPPLPREMFISTDDNFIIQIQRDRFIFNWRRQTDLDSYPRYPNVIEKFEANYNVFKRMMAEGQIDNEIIQYELVYNNHIPKGDLWDSVGDIGKLFSFANTAIDGSLLSEPEHLNWRTSFALPEHSGRLHATIRTNSVRKSDNMPIVVFELTVRGMATGSSDEARRIWFDQAREWIVKGFTDLTSSEAQERLWRRTR